MNTSKQKIERMKLKYPNRIPVVVNKSKNSNAPDIDKNKYLVPSDLTLGQFIFVIRKRINLNPEQAIYIFCKDTLPNTSMVMSELYNIYKNSNELLELTYNIENTFGSMPKILSFFNPILHPSHNIYNINKIFNKYKNKSSINLINDRNSINNNSISIDTNFYDVLQYAPSPVKNFTNNTNKSSSYYPYYSSDDSDFVDITSDISSDDDSDVSSLSETPIQDMTTREQIHHNEVHNFTTYAPFFRTSKSI